MEELEESVSSVVRQKHEREDPGEDVEDSDRTALVYRAETWAKKKAQENKLEVARCVRGVM